MCDVISQFTVQGYVHLPGFLDKESCAELTAVIQKLVEEQKTQVDDQCPLSDSLYGVDVFDSMLEQVRESIELACGKNLLPTYSYARLYAPGEELKNHTDRPACEISATITLGFDGDVWPIYMGDDMDKSNASEIRMEIGDAVVYRGMEKFHWREKYKEGRWQAQVFLHYVDADGPHADQKFDKRGSLNLPQFDIEPMRDWVYTDIFTPETCDMLIRTYDRDSVHKLQPTIGGGHGRVHRTVRNVERVPLFTYKDLGGRLAAAGFDANNQAWKFDITHANQAEFLKYPAGGRYKAHVDTFVTPKEKECRKLTVLLFLNDDFKGGRFFIQDGPQKYYPPQAKGTVLVFPSFLLHGVEDVEEGTRYTAVCWMVGPFFK